MATGEATHQILKVLEEMWVNHDSFFFFHFIHKKQTLEILYPTLTEKKDTHVGIYTQSLIS